MPYKRILNLNASRAGLLNLMSADCLGSWIDFRQPLLVKVLPRSRTNRMYVERMRFMIRNWFTWSEGWEVPRSAVNKSTSRRHKRTQGAGQSSWEDLNTRCWTWRANGPSFRQAPGPRWVQVSVPVEGQEKTNIPTRSQAGSRSSHYSGESQWFCIVLFCFYLFRPSTGWMRVAHIREDKLPYLVYLFKC